MRFRGLQTREAMIRTTLIISTLVFGLFCACNETTATNYCTYNSDCPDEGPRYCVNGVCQNSECLEDRDCTGGDICSDGVCGSSESTADADAGSDGSAESDSSDDGDGQNDGD